MPRRPRFYAPDRSRSAAYAPLTATVPIEETRGQIPHKQVRYLHGVEESLFESIWTALQAVPFEQGYIDAGGRRTRYVHAGSKTQPALVLLHGSAGHVEAYVRNLGAHAGHFSTWAIDMLGHGYTERAGRPLEVRDYADHVIGFLDAIGVERAHLSGESLGG